MALGRFPNIPQITAYNDYSFVATETVETLAYKITPKYDTSGRTVIYSVIEMTLHWYIADATTTSPEVLEMVAKLQRPAGFLEYTARGFGVGERVNRGQVWDVNYGPKPGPVELKPKSGEENIVECTWSVSFCIPTCDDAIYRNGIREFCFALEYDVDQAGLTTRTYKAHVSILVTRKSSDSREVPDTADRFLEDITPPPLLGYRRPTKTHSLSEDKATLYLTVVDKQFAALAPPPGCVDAKVSHRYSTRAPGFINWLGIITGHYTVAKSPTTGRDTVRTVEDFLGRADLRLAEVANMIIGRGVPGAGAILGAGERVGRNRIIPVAFSVEEPDAYGDRQIAISMTYSINGLGLSEILEKGGLWLPWGTQFNHYEASVPTLYHPRGEAKLVFSAKDDRIIDPCGPSGPKKPDKLPDQKPAGSGGTGDIESLVKEVFPGPSPASSWIEYVNHVTITADAGRVVGRTLPTEPILPGPVSAGGGWDVAQGLPNGLPSGSAFPPLRNELRPSETAGGTFVHQRAKPILRITISGHAVRWGFPVPVPELLQVNGERVVLVGTPAFTSGIVGNALVPVYGARWSLTYVATGDRAASKPVDPPPNSHFA